MKQKFRFAELYKNNRTAVEKTLAAMWCGEARNESQKGYVNQLKMIIPEVFAPKDAMPLVQCMNSYETVYPEHEAEAKEMVGTLWQKCMPNEDTYYPPYEHQYQCWKTLLKEKTPDGKNMSIVVTTGTGSGKTECFMLPLVQDLIEHHIPEQVQAIFLYPLNALMEDQKARMEKLLAGTNLTFAVYNGDMPEFLPNEEDKNYKKVLRKIDAIRGITRDEDGNVIEEKYPHVIATRAELRQHPANILLTNPTMLEYILLRDKDSKLIHEKQEEEGEGTLRWIALDETHTYTGAGATEIAMLIRRILMAYGVTTDEVRFATSSATIGNGSENAKEELKNFIARITGLQTNQVKYVDGKRKGIDVIPEEDKEYWLKLINDNHDGYIKLDDLITEGETIEEKLVRLDEMCQKAEDMGLEDLRVKVHYFYRVPNHGLYVDLEDSHYTEDGSFRVYLENKSGQRSKDDAPLLEMSRCKHCGEYVAIAEEVKYDDGIGYQPITMDDSDMFDLDNTEDTGKTLYVFGTTKSENAEYDNNIPYIIKGNRLLNVTASNPAPKFLSNILTMSRQMRALIEQMLELARTDSAESHLVLRPVDLSGLTARSLLPFEPLFFEQGLTLISQVDEGITVSGDEEALRRVLEILLDNAQKYSSPGGETQVALHRRGRNHCALTVANQGEPIPPEARRQIFQRFYRADPARSRNGSFGLGLSIAEGIVAQHHGTIDVTCAGGFNRFRVELPCRQE